MNSSPEPIFDLTFDHSYRVSLAELPGTGHPTPIYFPGASKSGGRHKDGILLRFIPQGGEQWLGLFAFGMLGKQQLSAVFSTPDPDCACIVANGAGHWINVNDQQDRELPILPVRDMRTVPAQQVLLINSFTDLAAFGTHGMLWRHRVSWDDLKIREIRDGKVFGTGSDPTNKEQNEAELSVDLKTGKVLRSAYF